MSEKAKKLVVWLVSTQCYDIPKSLVPIYVNENYVLSMQTNTQFSNDMYMLDSWLML